MTTAPALFGYFWNETLSQRKTGFSCPEKPIRNDILAPANILGNSAEAHHIRFEARDASILEAIHAPEYLDALRGAHKKGRRFMDGGDTAVTPDMFEQGLLAASAGCEAVDRIVAGGMERAFCALRPPGHHANRRRAFGYCIFNNAAIAVKYAQTVHDIGRVLVVDWDVHPGNGTQEIFWEDPSVLTLSVHQADLFPESGRDDLIGEGAGRGFNRNLPLPGFTPAKLHREAFESALAEEVRRFRPELLVIAAGFDAHRRDPAGQFLLEAEDFAELTRIALAAAKPHTGGRAIAFLEGGYVPGPLRESVAACVAVLAAP